MDISTIDKAISNGIAYATEDRKAYGLILIQEIKNNITLANLEAISDGGVINEPKELTVTREYRDKLNIKCSSIRQLAVNLSGGNQQKVVLSKWLFANPEILILDEPTRGIDVGAKYEIYTIINRLASEGKGIILISSELPEILGVCDRIYVMRDGKIVGEMPASEASQENVMTHIMTEQEVITMKIPATINEATSSNGVLKTLSNLFRSNIREYGMLIALIAVMVFFQFQTDGILIKPVNITNLVLQNSYVITMALGMLLIIVSGWIDLSVGSVVAVVGALAGVLMVKCDVNWAWPL